MSAVTPAVEGAPPKLSFCVLFYSVKKVGAWLVSLVMSIVAVFGGADLDFREAMWPQSGEVSLRLVLIFGGVDIKMGVPPPGVSLTVSALCIFGGVDIVVPPGVGVTSSGGALCWTGGIDDKCGMEGVSGEPQLKLKMAGAFGGIDTKRESAA